MKFITGFFRPPFRVAHTVDQRIVIVEIQEIVAKKIKQTFLKRLLPEARNLMEMGFDGARVKRWQVILVREYFVMGHHFNVYIVGVKPRWMLTIGDNPNLAYPRREHFNTPQRVHELIEILKSKFL